MKDDKTQDMPFVVSRAMAGARIQILEQQLSSGMFSKKAQKAMRLELDQLRTMHPGL